MRETVIVGVARTPVGTLRRTLTAVPIEELGGLAIREAVKRSGLKDPSLIDEVLMGTMYPAHGCTARVCLMQSGLPISIPAISVDRQCASGATTVALGTSLIQAGHCDFVVAGGAENYSRAPYLLERSPVAFSFEPPVLHMHRPMGTTEWGGGELTMPETGENVAREFKVSKDEQDEFGYYSQVKAARALKEGRFKEQIVPVVIPQKKKDPIIFDTDEHPRPGMTLEEARSLKPFFFKDGTITANSVSGINDGASALVITSLEKAVEQGLTPMARVVGFAAAGVDPRIMGIGPIPSTEKVMAKTGLKVADMDVIEMNEAFASQCIAACRALGIDWRDENRYNPNGGAIALGHPGGATMGILLIKALYELRRTNKRYGMATACAGGGQGFSIIIERC